MPTRREILQLGALGGAALILGVRGGAVFAATARPAAFTPGVWIRIERSGKTFLTIGKSEMGQGVRTSLAMILADELDADWSQIELVQGVPGPRLKDLGTGGSSSIPDSFGPLRLAAAAAREMLVAAAAARWGVAASACASRDGAVATVDGKHRLSYGELVAQAARMPVPKQPRVKALDELRIVGRDMKRLDAPTIVRGAAVYGLDVRIPGMRVASIERPPQRGRKLGRVDDAAARAVSGVRDVVAIGDTIAVVAADTWSAMKGREALKIDWLPAAEPGFGSAAHALRLEAAAAQPGFVTRSEGPPPADGTVVAARYVYPFAVHAAIEPTSCVAHVHGGRCEVWMSTQDPNEVQDVLARALGLSPRAVTVHVTLLGGGFGRRFDAGDALEAGLLSARIKAPVQVVWTRADDMRHGYYQAASVHEMWGVVARGRGLAWKHKKISSPHNLSGGPSPDELKDPATFYRDRSWGVYDIPYAFPSIETAYVPVPVPVRIGPWRAVFSPPSTFARECFIDELAHAAGADPLAFRLSLLEGPDVVQAGSLKIDRRRLRRVLELVAEKSSWGKPLPAGRFRGLACNVYDGETHVAYVVEVSADGGGGGLPFRVHRVVCALDCGLIVNPLGIAQQVDSGVAWALSNMKAEITFRDGQAVETSYDEFPVLTMAEAPLVETHLVPSHGAKPFGIGEPTVPPLPPAVANALFAATGKRIRRLPVRL